MKNPIKLFVLLTLLLLTVLALQSQETYLISDEGSITTCSGILYDSGGPDGDYSNSEDYTITIYAGELSSHVVLFFQEFNFESSAWDNLSIFDGESVASPTIIVQASSSALMGQEIVSSGDAITLVMHTDGSGNYGGFAVTISCGWDCQDYSIDIVDFSPEFTNVDSSWIDICLGESINFQVDADFPNNNINYVQNTVNLYYVWEFWSDINEVDEGYGLFNHTHQFNVPGGYSVHLKTRDSNGCEAFYEGDIKVRTSLRPDFANMIVDEGVCLGEPLVLNGDFIQDTFSCQSVLGNFYPICFEDVVGVMQSTCFSFYSLTKSDVITSSDDIVSVCMNMEHSYIGDLDIVLECPNGQSIVLFEQACGSTFFGEPDHNDDCEPGIGYDYCWTANAVSMISENCNSGASLPGGEYLPVESFEGLVGCPVDGTWCIRFMDNLGLDDGNVFNSIINLADGLNGNPIWEYTNTYDTSEDSPDIGWSGYGVQSEIGDTTFATVVDPGDYIYTFSVTDDWGCTHDTSFNVIVYNFDDPYCSLYCSDSVCTSLNDTINDGSGDIYPSQNNADCSWFISPNAKSDNAIFLRWDYFDLYPNDVLSIYDGDSEFSPLLGEYTFGSELPGSMLTTEGVAYIKYTTDSYNRSPGWSIIYETVLVDKPIENLSSIAIFPNPANEQLNIVGLVDNSQIIIYDFSGKVLKDINANTKIAIDISDLSSGIYFVKIQNEKAFEIFKIVKL